MDEKGKDEIYNHLSTLHSLIRASMAVTCREEYEALIFNENMPDEVKNNAHKIEMALNVIYHLVKDIEKSIDRLE